MNPRDQTMMKRTQSAVFMLLTALCAAPVAQAQFNAPITGGMLQETPEQRARMQQAQEAARQAQARQQAQQAQAQQAARQAQAQEAARRAQEARQAQASRPAPPQRVTTVVAPAADNQARAAAAPAPAPAGPVVVAVAPTSAAMPASDISQRPGANLPDGVATRRALDMQSSGRYAGQALPMLGVEATPAWNRYVKSFDHELPQFYETLSQPKSQQR